MTRPRQRRDYELLETAQRPNEDSERSPPEREGKIPASRRARSCQHAVTSAPAIPRHAHAPAPSPSRRWSIRCIAFALVTDGNLVPPLAPRFRLRFGCAPLHSGLLSAIRCAPFSVPLPLAAPQTEAPSNQLESVP